MNYSGNKTHNMMSSYVDGKSLEVNQTKVCLAPQTKTTKNVKRTPEEEMTASLDFAIFIQVEVRKYLMI